MVELLITVAIILTIVAIAVPNMLGAINQAKIARAVGDIHAIGTDAEAYDLSNSQYPNTLADIGYATSRDANSVATKQPSRKAKSNSLQK